VRVCGQAAVACYDAPSAQWATLPVDVIGHVICHMHHATLEALSEVNAHWRAAVKVGARAPLRILGTRRQPTGGAGLW